MNLSEIGMPEFMRLIGQPSAPALAPTLRRMEQQPLAPQYRDMSVDDCRARLRALKDEAVRRSSNGRWSNAEAMEWAALPVNVRMCALLLAGIEGNLEELGLREWRELPPPERAAIKAEIRHLADAMAPLRSLTLRT